MSFLLKSRSLNFGKASITKLTSLTSVKPLWLNLSSSTRGVEINESEWKCLIRLNDKSTDFNLGILEIQQKIGNSFRANMRWVTHISRILCGKNIFPLLMKNKYYWNWSVKSKNLLHRPGIEPGPPAWQASILPLNQRCFLIVAGAGWFSDENSR